ncbi:hypothetical protein CR105_08230 [Massilia eurypsychrophila]|uniref:DUF2059 domain-containing protein n=1 Tax=Massilia eurypsychrophila TaxID=1485217 RepID=A0A2G8TGJ5_9BURK|nr:DUF2059 domain-containing protein [Massilia eurypsychrophila]PIL45177.1 hypothetical protein CR105_08230 [Massilia eurypsychrophila]
MRRSLAVVLFLFSCAAAAQTDERRVRTVQTDEVPDQSPYVAAQVKQVPEQTELSEERTDPPEHPDERMVLARQLAALGQKNAGEAQPDASCAAASETIRADLAAAYRTRPGDFHGISPQSAYWPEVVRAWHAYRGDRCGGDSPAAILARSYAEAMSTAELRDVIAFQATPSGRAFIAATQRARAGLENALAKRSSDDGDDALDVFQQEMLRLKTQYEDDPK